MRLRLRHEVRATERRAALVPADAARLVERGVVVTVEESPRRAFPLADYVAAGCPTAPAGSWVSARRDDVVLGVKELPEEPAALSHRHVYFGHAYKGQPGAAALLRRFVAGGGVLLDLEYLVDGGGRRLAAFGYWAGYVGAALGVLHARGRLDPPLVPGGREDLDRALAASRGPDEPRVLVVGALGRSGRGARDALAVAGVEPTCWDVAETRVLDRPALLGHDVLVNTVAVTRPVPPFLTIADLDDPGRRLTTVVDVTADVGSELNVLPVYDGTTDWDRPVRRLRDGGDAGGVRPLDVVAIDNLPSLLPAEASTAFSAELAPHLLALGDLPDGPAAAPWRRCLDAFERACRDAGLITGTGS